MKAETPTSAGIHRILASHGRVPSKKLRFATSWDEHLPAGFLDYVAGWFIKAAEFERRSSAVAAFVATNSICQGQSESILWPVLFHAGCDILFAYTSFKWLNLASNKAGVTVVVVGIGRSIGGPRRLYEHDEQDKVVVREGTSITPYLTLGSCVIVEKRDSPISSLSVMEFGNKPTDGGHLLLRAEELPSLNLETVQRDRFIRRIYGSQDFINGGERFCIWIEDRDLQEAQSIETIRERIEAVRQVRLASPDKGANALAKRAHQLKHRTVLTNLAFGLYDAPLWNMALIASRLHLVWIATVCGKLKTDFRYSNTLGWNTFPVPTLTEKNEDILLVREHHFPATIADLYDPDNMPDDLRHAHERNDEVLGTC